MMPEALRATFTWVTMFLCGGVRTIGNVKLWQGRPNASDVHGEKKTNLLWVTQEQHGLRPRCLRKAGFTVVVLL